MSFLLFAVALFAIVLFAIVINRMTGTKANYLETLQLQMGEKELWRDVEADFAMVPRLGRAVVMSYARIRRHTVVWTNRRIIISQKTLFSSTRMITHQIYFAREVDAASPHALEAAREFSGGFYGRGFATIVAETKSFGRVNEKDCVRIRPTEACGVTLNLDEAIIFTDRLSEVQQSLHSVS